MFNRQFPLDRSRPAKLTGATTYALFLIITLTWLGGCAVDLPPEAVADRFWRAVITAHPEKIRRYVRAVDQHAVSGGADIGEINSKKFGRILTNGDEATVETFLTFAGDSAFNIAVDTRLVRENKAWRVDYRTTMDDLSRQTEIARVVDQIHRLGEKLKLGIDRSVGELTEAVPKLENEISRIESELKEGLPKLRQRIEEFSRQMEKALKQPPNQSGSPASKPSPI